MKRLYVIIDFSASKKATHHWKSIEDFHNLLVSNHQEVSTYVPKYADPDLFRELAGIKRILSSPDYGPVKGQYFMLRLTNFILAKILGNTNHSKLPRIKRKLRALGLHLFTKRMQKELRALSDMGHEIMILIPTLEPLSLYLMETTIGALENSRWFVRVIDAQERGVFAVGNETSKLLGLNRSYSSQLRIGYETFPYCGYLRQTGFEEESLFWSPFPPSSRQIEKEGKELQIGFLGSAKRRKGFEIIPSILEEVQKSCPDYIAYVQQAQFPWQGYLETLNELKRNVRVRLLDGELSDEDLRSHLVQCHVVFLPYDAESYSRAASAILYHAADHSIPVISRRGTGFGFEISQFGLGFEFVNLTEISSMMDQIVSGDSFSMNNFANYNQKRLSTNLLFLDI